MSLTVLICAAGSQSRWEESGGQDFKQLIEIDGETLIERLYRQVVERGHTDVVTLVRDPTLDCWQGVNPQVPAHEDWHGEMGKFLDGRPYWPERGGVVILYGDAYYTEATLDAILNHQPTQPTVYGRANSGRRSESFAFRFSAPDDVAEVDRVCRVCAAAGLNKRGGPWRWFYYRTTGRKSFKKTDRAALTGLATEANGWVEVGHDATDDFDDVGHLTTWLARRAGTSDERTEMRVKLTASFAGVHAAYNVGDVISVSTGEANRLFTAGLAEPVGTLPADRDERRTDDIDDLKRPGLLRLAKEHGIPGRGSNDELRAALKAVA